MSDFSNLSTEPARKSARYIVRLANGETFSVFVHRGSVPREAVGAMLTVEEVEGAKITVESGGL